MERLKNRSALGWIGSAAVITAFVLCERMLETGSEYSEGQWMGAPITTLLAFAFSLLILPFFAASFAILFDGKRAKGIKKAARAVVLVAACGAALWVGASVASKGVKMVADVMGIESEGWLIAAVLLLTAAFAASLGDGAVKKFALVSLAVTVITGALLLALSLSLGGGGAESVKIIASEQALKEAVNADAIKRSFLSVFSPCAVGIVWLSLTEKGRKRVGNAIPRTIIGIVSGGAVLATCFLSVMLSEGVAYSSSQSYPYVSAAGAMTAGKLFMRPEGAVYFAYLAVLFTALAVSVSLAGRVLGGGHTKKGAYAAAAVMMVLYIFIR